MRTEPSPRLHVVLVEPEIHWNTGNIGRTCLATGARLHLVEPLGFSLEAREVRRAGLDYWRRVRPRIWRTWESLSLAVPRLGDAVLFTPTADRLFWDCDFQSSNVLVFGSETRGLPRHLLESYPGQTARIPQQTDSVRSLNLSTAVGIALYEALRQRSMVRGSVPHAPSRRTSG